MKGVAKVCWPPEIWGPIWGPASVGFRGTVQESRLAQLGEVLLLLGQGETAWDRYPVMFNLYKTMTCEVVGQRPPISCNTDY